jgi:ABC-type multidrug transport system fused ATPase/permease subunit
MSIPSRGRMIMPWREGSFVPSTLFGFIWRTSGRHQPWIGAIAVVVLLLGTAPLEIQRRVINDAFKRSSLQQIALLVLVYVLIVLVLGLLKLGLNLYRNWVSERAVRALRNAVFAGTGGRSGDQEQIEGVQLSVILEEAEPVGGFVGASLTQPLQQAGLLASVTGYLIYLQPWMALIIAAVLIPQMAFVAPIQAAINQRVMQRIGVLRDMSRGIVSAAGAIDPDESQHGRISEVFGLNMSIYRLKFTMNFLTNLTAHLGTAAVLGLGGYFVIAGQTEVGTVVAFLSGLGQILDPWDELVTWYRDMRATQVKYGLLQKASQMGALAWVPQLDENCLVAAGLRSQ